jgi:hypothetical protein
MGAFCSCEDREISTPEKWTMRVLGACIFFLSIVEFGITGKSFSMFSDVHNGAFWGAIVRLVLIEYLFIHYSR